MAKPIKHTPVLTGKAAINFLSKMKENKTKVAPQSYLSSIQDNAKQLQSILKIR
jgi:hypothetical protein